MRLNAPTPARTIPGDHRPRFHNAGFVRHAATLLDRLLPTAIDPGARKVRIQAQPAARNSPSNIGAAPRSRPMAAYHVAIPCLAAVVVVLALGLWNLMRGGSPNRSQKLMRCASCSSSSPSIVVMTALYGRPAAGADRQWPILSSNPQQDLHQHRRRRHHRLVSGQRRPKHDLRVDAYGTVDETNSAIGVARLHRAGCAGNRRHAGASRTTCSTSAPIWRRPKPAPGAEPRAAARHRRAGCPPRSARSTRSTAHCRRCAPSSCPAAAPAAAHLHLARTVARRAERLVVRTGGAREPSTGQLCATSTGCRISSSSPPALPMTMAPATCYGCPARTADDRDNLMGASAALGHRDVHPAARRQPAAPYPPAIRDPGDHRRQLRRLAPGRRRVDRRRPGRSRRLLQFYGFVPAVANGYGYIAGQPALGA